VLGGTIFVLPSAVEEEDVMTGASTATFPGDERPQDVPTAGGA